MSIFESLRSHEMSIRALLASDVVSLCERLSEAPEVCDIANRINSNPSLVPILCSFVETMLNEEYDHQHRHPNEIAICAALIALASQRILSVRLLLQQLRQHSDPSLGWVPLVAQQCNQQFILVDTVTDDIVLRSVDIAKRGHRGQKRWNGSEYITHPLRMMDKCATNDLKVVCVLHDVVEDSVDNCEGETFTLQDLLREGIPQYIVDAVDSVTRRSKETYLDFILRAKQNRLGKQVKLLDLQDNLSDSHLGSSRDKYIMAFYLLEENA